VSLQTIQDLRGWLLRGSLITLIGRVAFGAFAILQSAVLANMLDGPELAAYLLTQTVILASTLFALWGNDLLAVAWIGANRNLPMVVLSGTSVVLGLSLLTGLVVAVGTVCLAALSPTWALLATWGWWLIPLVTLSSVQMYFAAVFRGMGQIGRATLLNGVLSSLLLLGASGFVYGRGISLTASGAIGLQTAALAVSVTWELIELIVVLRSSSEVFRGRLTGLLREIWKVGGALMLTQMLAFIVTQSDIWIVSGFAYSSDVAGYALAARLAQLVSLPHLVLNGVLPPLMASWFSSRQYERLNHVIGLAVQAALGVAVSIAAFYVVGGRVILQNLFHGYGASYNVLIILTIGNVVNVAAGPCSQMLIMVGQGRCLLAITTLTCVLCCGLGVPAGLLFGPCGTAAVFAAGLAFQGIMSAYWTQRRTRIYTYPKLIARSG
jgi:O-antigen/teichoic acid export membrane protein